MRKLLNDFTSLLVYVHDNEVVQTLLRNTNNLKHIITHLTTKHRKIQRLNNLSRATTNDFLSVSSEFVFDILNGSKSIIYLSLESLLVLAYKSSENNKKTLKSRKRKKLTVLRVC